MKISFITIVFFYIDIIYPCKIQGNIIFKKNHHYHFVKDLNNN